MIFLDQSQLQPPLPLHASTTLLQTRASMKRSSTAIRQWLQLSRALASPNSTTPSPRANGFLSPPSAALLVLPTSRSNSSNSTRGFHSTRCQHAQSRNARPAPATRRKRTGPDGHFLPDRSGFVSREGVMRHPLGSHATVTLEEWRDLNLTMSRYFYDRAIRDGYLSSAISFKTFRDVQAQLCTVSYLEAPSAQAIRAISVGM